MGTWTRCTKWVSDLCFWTVIILIFVSQTTICTIFICVLLHYFIALKTWVIQKLVYNVKWNPTWNFFRGIGTTFDNYATTSQLISLSLPVQLMYILGVFCVCMLGGIIIQLLSFHVNVYSVIYIVSVNHPWFLFFR